MTKEEYAVIRASGRVNTSLCYLYWTENKRSWYEEIPIEEFEQKFVNFLKVYDGLIIPAPDGNVKLIQSGKIAEKIFTYFDNKFGMGSMGVTQDIPDNETNV